MGGDRYKFMVFLAKFVLVSTELMTEAESNALSLYQSARHVTANSLPISVHIKKLFPEELIYKMEYALSTLNNPSRSFTEGLKFIKNAGVLKGSGILLSDKKTILAMQPSSKKEVAYLAEFIGSVSIPPPFRTATKIKNSKCSVVREDIAITSRFKERTCATGIQKSIAYALEGFSWEHIKTDIFGIIYAVQNGHFSLKNGIEQANEWCTRTSMAAWEAVDHYWDRFMFVNAPKIIMNMATTGLDKEVTESEDNDFVARSMLENFKKQPLSQSIMMALGNGSMNFGEKVANYLIESILLENKALYEVRVRNCFRVMQAPTNMNFNQKNHRYDTDAIPEDDYVARFMTLSPYIRPPPYACVRLPDSRDIQTLNARVIMLLVFEKERTRNMKDMITSIATTYAKHIKIDEPFSYEARAPDGTFSLSNAQRRRFDFLLTGMRDVINYRYYYEWIIGSGALKSACAIYYNTKLIKRVSAFLKPASFIEINNDEKENVSFDTIYNETARANASRITRMQRIGSKVRKRTVQFMMVGAIVGVRSRISTEYLSAGSSIPLVMAPKKYLSGTKPDLDHSMVLAFIEDDLFNFVQSILHARLFEMGMANIADVVPDYSTYSIKKKTTESKRIGLASVSTTEETFDELRLQASFNGIRYGPSTQPVVSLNVRLFHALEAMRFKMWENKTETPLMTIPMLTASRNAARRATAARKVIALSVAHIIAKYLEQETVRAFNITFESGLNDSRLPGTSTEKVDAGLAKPNTDLYTPAVTPQIITRRGIYTLLQEIQSVLGSKWNIGSHFVPSRETEAEEVFLIDTWDSSETITRKLSVASTFCVCRRE